MDSNKRTLVVALVVIVVFFVGGFFLLQKKSSQVSKAPAPTEKKVAGAQSVQTTVSTTPEPTLEPVAPETSSYDGKEKYSFDLSYPAAYESSEIDTSSFPGEPKPIFGLVFSDIEGGKSDYDPTFVVYEGKGKSLDQWVTDYKGQKDEKGAARKVISERAILVSNQPAHEVVTATADSKVPSYKRVFISFDGKIYALSYYPNYKPGHAQVIWNTLRFLKP